MKNIREKLSQFVKPIAEGFGCEFWGCEVHQQGGRSLVRIYIDKTDGITVEDCERISRQVSAVLEVEDPIPGGYDLEVSSPGLDRPLFTLEQYQRFLGKRIKIRLHIPQEGRRNFAGILQAVNSGRITVAGENNEVWVLPFADIEKGNLILEYK